MFWVALPPQLIHSLVGPSLAIVVQGLKLLGV